MTINVPVEAIGKECIACEMLEIRFDYRHEDYTGSGLDTNYFKCSHLDQCLIIKRCLESRNERR